jgi:hypothetical protein
MRLIPAPSTEKQMTSVLYGSGLNYQTGNPIRSEIRQIERRVNDLVSSFEDLKKGFSGGGASTGAPSAATSTEFEGRIQKISDDFQSVHGSLSSILGRLDRAEGSAGDFGSRISRIESSQLGASSMVMEQRSIIDRLVARIEKLEAAAAAASAPAPAPVTATE